MPHYLLLGAGSSRNWGGPLSEEITGSLLAELYDDATLVSALRQGPFEDAFRGFSPTGAVDQVSDDLKTRLAEFFPGSTKRS